MENNKYMEEKILEQVVRDISLFNIRKEIEKKQERDNTNQECFLKRVAVFLLSLLVISGTSFATYYYFKNIHTEKVYALSSIKEAEESGYIDNIEMDYIYAKNIGAKVNSIILSDNNMDIILDFDFKQEQLTHNNILVNAIIYDENKTIYANSDTPVTSKGKYLQNFYKEKEIPYNQSNWYEGICARSIRQNSLLENSEQCMIQMSFTANQKPFPRSQKLYITIFNLGYIEEGKFTSISNHAEWNIEIEIPEKFYERKTTKYELKEEIEGFQLNNAYITETSMTLLYSSETIDGQDVILVDENGKEYFPEAFWYKTKENTVLQYAINQNTKTNKLYLKILGKEWELVENENR